MFPFNDTDGFEEMYVIYLSCNKLSSLFSVIK